MQTEIKEALLTKMFDLLTAERKALFDKVLANRTRYITVILENIYQSHNASAVLRSCDLTGVQDVHIIENSNKYKVNPDVALGSSKWLNLIQYNQEENNTKLALDQLKNDGYRIIATTPHVYQQTIHELPFDGKFALMFGTELEGLSQEAIELADEYMIIPMYGFTESYNISVAAALSLFTLTERLRDSDIFWRLTDEEILDVKLEWARRTIKRSDVIENQFLKNITNSK